MDFGTIKANDISKLKSIKNTLIYGELLEKPDLTIAIPVYGFNVYLKETLLSIKNQLKSNLSIQILIADNKVAPDDSQKIISCLKEIDLTNTAYFLTDKALTQLNNFNNAVLLSKTNYVCMIHDDDLLSRDFFLKVEKVLPYLEKNKRIGIACGKFKIFNESKEVNQKNGADERVTISKISKSKIALEGNTGCGIPSCGYLIQKEAFLKSGGFNDSFQSSGDAFMAGIMLKLGYKIMKFENITGYYRISNNASLKLNLCQGFIKEDFYFGEDWSNDGSVFRKIMMSLFRNYRYSKNIELKVKMFGCLNPEITIESLDFRKTYKKYHKYGFHRCIKGFIKILIKTGAFLSRKTFKIKEEQK